MQCDDRPEPKNFEWLWQLRWASRRPVSAPLFSLQTLSPADFVTSRTLLGEGTRES
jgi:hypothetical protein